MADEGPPNGITLDQAIERLVRDNPDLRTRWKQLPKAEADIITAGLRNNPFLFGDVSNVPYGNYSPQRPGEVSYEITIIQPWDVNQKRKVRICVAENARNVLECLYQDAVRVEIDNLYTAFLDVLAAREALRQQQVGLEGLEEIVKATRKLFEGGGTIAKADLDRASGAARDGLSGGAGGRIGFAPAKQASGRTAQPSARRRGLLWTFAARSADWSWNCRAGPIDARCPESSAGPQRLSTRRAARRPKSRWPRRIAGPMCSCCIRPGNCWTTRPSAVRTRLRGASALW